MGIFTQELLDNGITPKQIYDKSNQYLDSLYGKTYAGGLIFYLNTTDGTGLVATPSDLGQAQWGCAGTEIGGTNRDVGTGQANTTTIVTACTAPGIAAKICDDLVLNGFSDWFLPSKDELLAMYRNLKAKDFGSFQNRNYWSSSETYSINACSVHFDDGHAYSNANKLNSYFVRAVRAF